MLKPTMRKDVGKVANSNGFLRRLRDDQRGNALAMMTMALFPLAGLVGGGVDMSRLYLSKTRLQQACDAGALAGRKVMGAGAWNANDNAASKAATQFFDGNFADGAYGTSGRTRTFTEAAGKVSGAASVVVPMTIMRIFGSRSQTLNVVCDAEMRLPNTDVMFVLDTTGSMGETLSGDTATKIVVLRKAVKCFYESLARLDTTATCGTGAAPSGGTGTQTQIRFGFVPYAVNVNVGKLLPTAYFADSWPYQSREAVLKTESYQFQTGTTVNTSTGSPSNTGDSYIDRVEGPYATYTGSTNTNVKERDCKAPANDPVRDTGSQGPRYDERTVTSGTSTTTTWKTKQPAKYEYEYKATWSTASKGTCKIERRITTVTHVRSFSQTDTRTETPIYETRTRQVFDHWRYAKIDVDIRGLKNGTTWNNSFLLPIGDTVDGEQTINQKTINWDGCIEERKTDRATSYTSETGGSAKDLDIDTLPTSSDPESLWGPALYDLIYARSYEVNYATGATSGALNRDPVFDEKNFAKIRGNGLDRYHCPRQASKLQIWPDATDFESYVDALTPDGNTYHDIGLLWGARFISPTGIFRSENEFAPGRGDIQRHLIFMTDGQTCTEPLNYGAYGLPWFDRRQTNDGSVPTGGCSGGSNTGGTLSEQVDARFTALCTAVKNKNITLWVVYFGTTDATTTARMTTCATDSTKFKAANNAAALETAFSSIATQISQLRLTQ